MSPLAGSLTPAETAEKLRLAPSVIDALVKSGALLCHVDDGTQRIPLEQIETLFRDTLLRLYRAEAGIAAPAPAPPVVEIEQEIPSQVLATASENEPMVIMRSIAEETSEERDLRMAPRYTPRRQIAGMFNNVKFTVLQISSSGLRIRHDKTLLPGEEARLTFALLRSNQSFVMRARVAWTSIAQKGDGPTFCISGLRVTDYPERLRAAVETLRASRELEPDLGGSGRRANATTKEVPPAITGATDEEVATIIKAVRKFANDPVEANRWLARARFALADQAIRAAAPRRAGDREQVVGIWEYLERRVEIEKIAGVVTWMRSTRAAAV